MNYHYSIGTRHNYSSLRLRTKDLIFEVHGTLDLDLVVGIHRGLFCAA